MKKTLLHICVLLACASTLSAQEIDSFLLQEVPQDAEISSVEMEELEPTPIDYGKFNYGYVRLAFLRPLGNFNNPLGGEAFSGAENFAYRKSIPHGALTLGIESGRVRHLNKLKLGTPMLRLGINSGFGLHAFGPASQSSADYYVETYGTYILRLGLGPQVTFKPTPKIRVGLYYRAGIGLAYGSYFQETTEQPGSTYYYAVLTQAVNYAYNGDLGLDFTYGILHVGLAYSHMGTQLQKGQLMNLFDFGEEVNGFYADDETGESVTPIDPRLKYHRFAVSLGITF